MCWCRDDRTPEQKKRDNDIQVAERVFFGNDTADKLDDLTPDQQEIFDRLVEEYDE